MNRVSLGVQSMRPHVLAALGSHARPGERARAPSAGRATPGIERVNLDLIYGTPGERVDDWEATLDAALALEPHPRERVRAHGRAGHAPRARASPPVERAAPDDDDQATKYELADDRLGAAGLEWYEISNWARPGDECRHNLLYWAGGEYAGIGCAAHGHTIDATTGASADGGTSARPSATWPR